VDFQNGLDPNANYLLWDKAGSLQDNGSETGVYADTIASGRDYNLHLKLTWNANDAEDEGKAHGTFTVNSGTFTVDTALANNSNNTDKNYDNWDGKSLTKSGSGTLVLSAANTFDGDVDVTAGVLVLAGSNNISGSATVASGATLQVTAAAAGTSALGHAESLHIDVGATLDLTAGAIETLNLAAATSVELLGQINFTLGASGNADLIQGNASSTVLHLDTTTFFRLDTLAGQEIDTDKTYTLFDNFSAIYLGAQDILGANATATVVAGVDIQIEGLPIGYQASLLFTKDSNDLITGQLSFAPVPEPGTWAMMLGGVGLLALLRRRHR
jgi:autotransporter-associated beta strand protein